MLDRGYWPIVTYTAPEATKAKGGIATGKEPIGNGWGLERWTRQRIRDAFRFQPGGGVGMCLGPGRAPNGDWNIDIEGDGPQAEESRRRLLGDGELYTPTSRSRRGDHTFLGDKQETVEKFLELLTAAGAEEGTGEKAGVYHLREFPDLEIRVGGHKKGGAVKQVQTVLPPTTQTGLPARG